MTIPQSGPDIFDKCRTDDGYFGAFRAAGDQFFSRPILEGPVGPVMDFQGQKVLVWSINNYLGMARNERVGEVAARALAQHSISAPMGSRLLTGNTERHQLLEQRLATFLAKDAAAVFNYGYLGVMGTIDALVGPQDTILIDRLSHACIVDGARLVSKKVRSFRHNNVEDLERLLKATRDEKDGGILIVTEGVYGMTGDLAPLADICDLKDRYGARLFVDDAHGFMVMGETGQGTAEHWGVQDKIDLYFGTFAKAFAAIGGVTAGPKAVVDWIKYNARTNVFAKALPMVYVESLLASLEIIQADSHRRDTLWARARQLQDGLRGLGYDLGQTQSPITPVYVPAGSYEMAMDMVKMLRSGELGNSGLGIFVSAVVYPVVPKGIVLFRLIPTAAHTEEHVEQTVLAFKDLRDQLELALT